MRDIGFLIAALAAFAMSRWSRRRRRTSGKSAWSTSRTFDVKGVYG